MGNEFYHEFTIGFNAWMVVAPVMLVLAAILATQQFVLTPRLKIRRNFGNGILKLMTLICGMVFATMLASESWRGILQWCDNSLAGDSGAYSLVLMPMCIGAVSALYGFLIYVTMRMVAWARLGYLVERRKVEHKHRKVQVLEEILESLQHEQILEVERLCQEEAIKQAEEGAQLEAETLRSGVIMASTASTAVPAPTLTRPAMPEFSTIVYRFYDTRTA